MPRSFVPYDFYPEFAKGFYRSNASTALRLRALFFDRCVISASALISDPQLLGAIENNLELCKSGFVELATYAGATRLSEQVGQSRDANSEFGEWIAKLQDAGLRTISFDLYTLRACSKKV
jgi:hypothetical protein